LRLPTAQHLRLVTKGVEFVLAQAVHLDQGSMGLVVVFMLVSILAMVFYKYANGGYSALGQLWHQSIFLPSWIDTIRYLCRSTTASELVGSYGRLALNGLQSIPIFQYPFRYLRYHTLVSFHSYTSEILMVIRMQR